MAVSDDDRSGKRLAQTQANRRHIGRLGTAERRDDEHAADRRAEREAETGCDPLVTPDVFGRHRTDARRGAGRARA